MRLPKLFLLASSATLAASQLIALPFLRPEPSPRDPPPAARDKHQKPLENYIMPGFSGGGDDPKGAVRLSDVMSRDKSINIFAGFVQDVGAVSRRLDDQAKNTTVLAPLNSAVEALPRKPWEDPREYGELGTDAYEGDDGKERATRNLERFVQAHMIPESPWGEGDKATPIGDDRPAWWEEKDGKRYIQPGDIEVVSVGNTVANGELWIIKTVRNYA